MALKCFAALKRKLQRDEKCRNDYIIFISNLLEKGHAELVPSEELNDDTWYVKGRIALCIIN